MTAGACGGQGVSRKQTVSLLYFTIFCALACQGRFMALFFSESLGLSNASIGYILAAGTIVGLFSTPLWSALSDYLKKQRAVLIATVGGGAVSALLYLVPLLMPAIDWSNGDGIAWWTLFVRCLYCFFFSPTIGIIDSIAVHSLDNAKKDFGQCRKWGALAWGLVSAFVLGPVLDCCDLAWIQPVGFVVFALLAVITTQVLLSDAQQADQTGGCGRNTGPYAEFKDMDEEAGHDAQCWICALKDDDALCWVCSVRGRDVWGHKDVALTERREKAAQQSSTILEISSGQSAASSTSTLAAGAADVASQSCRSMTETCCVEDSNKAGRAGTSTETASIKAEGAGPCPAREERPCTDAHRDWVTVLAQRTWRGLMGIGDVLKRTAMIVWVERWLSLVFFLMLFVMGACTSLVEGLVFLFFTQDLGASNFMCGISVAVTVSFEIPIFHCSDQLLKVLNNHQLMTISALAYIFRVVWYTSFVNPWMILVVEPLHGVTFACKALAAVHYAAELAPPGLETSAQGLSNTVMCLGVITGSMLGGYVMDTYGSIFLYRSAAGLVAVTWVLYLAVTLSHAGAGSLWTGRRQATTQQRGQQEQGSGFK